MIWILLALGVGVLIGGALMVAFLIIMGQQCGPWR